MSNGNYMDSLRNLPVDNNQLSQNEKHSFNKIYPETKTGDDAFNAISSEIKDTLIAGLLFIGLSLPITNKCVDKIMGDGTSSVGKLAVKAIVFMAIFYIVKNLPYMKNNS